MFTTNKFSIRADRGMGELDPPGTYRERGVEGGARTAREDVFGAKPRQVRADKAGSSPPSDFSFSAGFLFIEKKKCKNPWMMG